MERALDLIISFGSAVFAALFVGTIAHDDLGLSVAAIRTDALSGAGLIFAVLAGTAMLKRK
jgi:hypothetical protein